MRPCSVVPFNLCVRYFFSCFLLFASIIHVGLPFISEIAGTYLPQAYMMRLCVDLSYHLYLRRPCRSEVLPHTYTHKMHDTKYTSKRLQKTNSLSTEIRLMMNNMPGSSRFVDFQTVLNFLCMILALANSTRDVCS